MTKATNALRLVIGEIFTNPQAMYNSSADVAFDTFCLAPPLEDGWKMTSIENRAYTAAFYYKPLRAVVRLFWLVYRFGRWSGALPSASDEPWN